MEGSSEECSYVGQINKMPTTKVRFQVCCNVNCKDFEKALQANVTGAASHLSTFVWQCY